MEDTTSSRIKLMAVIKGLEELTEPSVVTVLTSSMYVKNGITKWLPLWDLNGWSAAGGNPANLDLWQLFKKFSKKHLVACHCIGGRRSKGTDRASLLASGEL